MNSVCCGSWLGVEFGVWCGVGVGEAEGVCSGVGVGRGAFGSGVALGSGDVKNGMKVTLPKSKSSSKSCIDWLIACVSVVPHQLFVAVMLREANEDTLMFTVLL